MCDKYHCACAIRTRTCSSSRVREEHVDEMFLGSLQHADQRVVDGILVLVQPASDVVAHLQVCVMYSVNKYLDVRQMNSQFVQTYS